MKTAKSLGLIPLVFASSLFGILAAVACGGSTDAGIDPGMSTSPTEPGPGSSGSTPSHPDPGPAPTSTTPPPKTTIVCGAASCTTGTQECCVTASSGMGGGGGGSSASGSGGTTPGITEACVAKGKCNGDLVLSCSSASSCTGGQVCCLDTGNGISAPTATCQASCMAAGGGRPVQLCSANTECKTGTCKASQYGVKICSTGGGGKDGGAHDGGGHFDGGFGEAGPGGGGM